MSQEIAQFHEIDILHINSPVLDQLQSQDDLKILLLDVIVVIENSIPT